MGTCSVTKIVDCMHPFLTVCDVAVLELSHYVVLVSFFAQFNLKLAKRLFGLISKRYDDNTHQYNSCLSIKLKVKSIGMLWEPCHYCGAEVVEIKQCIMC